MRLLIAVPSYEKWEPEFGHSLALIMADLARNADGIESVRLSRCDATIIAAGRVDLVADAHNNNATHILWCDTDMRFRPHHVRTLLRSDVDVVGTTYPKRLPPHEMTAVDLDGKPILPQVDGGLVEAIHIGFGLAVTKTDVFDRLPEPWFAFPWIESRKIFMGEDVWFCRHARAHGISIHVDQHASAGIGHVGKQIFEAGS